VVAVRDADPGTTIVAGQAVVEVIDPKSLWINVRFDQISASGLAGGLPAPHRPAFAWWPDLERSRAAGGTQGRRGHRGNACQGDIR
jgi:hypothetical protein